MRSQISKLRLSMTKLERKKEKIVKHINKLVQTGMYIDKVLSTYKEVLEVSAEAAPPLAPTEATVEEAK